MAVRSEGGVSGFAIKTIDVKDEPFFADHSGSYVMRSAVTLTNGLGLG